MNKRKNPARNLDFVEKKSTIPMLQLEIKIIDMYFNCKVTTDHFLTNLRATPTLSSNIIFGFFLF
jgi:hypothetical protein